MKFIFARSHSVIRKAWEDSAEVLSPTIDIEVPDADLTPGLRKKFTGVIADLTGLSSANGKLCYFNPVAINHSSSYYPTLDAPISPAEVVWLLEKTLADYEVARIEKAKQEEEERRAREEKERRVEEEKERGENRLKGWAMANGSDLLKARIDMDFSWRELAEQEFFAVHCPAGYVLDCDIGYDQDKDRTVPDLREIEELRKAREQFAGLPRVKQVSLSLLWTKHVHDEDGNCYYDKEADCEDVEEVAVRVRLVAPNGAICDTYRLL